MGEVIDTEAPKPLSIDEAAKSYGAAMSELNRLRAEMDAAWEIAHAAEKLCQEAEKAADEAKARLLESVEAVKEP